MTSLYKGLHVSRFEIASEKTAKAVLSLPLQFLAGIKNAFTVMTDWQKRHSERAHLMSLDTRLLADMGLTEAERQIEANKPFWVE